MNEIRHVLKQAARRMELARFLIHLHAAVLAAAVVALALILADRSTLAPFVPWVWVIPALIGASLVGAMALWMRGRSTELHVALAVDERLDLREKLSTALHCRSREDVFAQAAIDDAVRTARDPRTRERVQRLFAVAPPRGWWAGPMVTLAALLAAQLPQMDLFSPEERQEQTQLIAAQKEAEQTLEVIVNDIKEQSELSQELEQALGELTDEPLSGSELKTPEEIKRDALKKVDTLNRRLEEILEGEKGATAQALDQALKQLKSPADGPAKELSDSLKAGDFKGAQEALQKLMQEMKDGKLDDAQMQQAAQQMQDLARQLEELAKQQQALEDALKQAGMDPRLAQNMQALQQAIANNQNLNQEQQQQLQQMARAQQAANQQCQGLGQMAQQMAQAMQNGQQQQGQQAGQQMGQMISQMEAMQQMLQQAQAAANKCQGQCQKLGQGMGQQQSQMAGGAFGNRGQGAGGQAPKSRTPSGRRLDHSPGVTSPDGDIIFRQFIDGEQITGESTAQLKAAVATATAGMEEGLSENQLPRVYHDVHKRYFGELEAMIKAQENKAPEATAPAKEGETTGGASKDAAKPAEKAAPSGAGSTPPAEKKTPL
jgi:hypothetical protein